jgi:hypothetical protein
VIDVASPSSCPAGICRSPFLSGSAHAVGGHLTLVINVCASRRILRADARCTGARRTASRACIEGDREVADHSSVALNHRQWSQSWENATQRRSLCLSRSLECWPQQPKHRRCGTRARSNGRHIDVRQLPFAARTGRRHRHREGLFGGPQTFDEPTFTVKGANITPDPDSGIGKWSADDRAGIQQWICGDCCDTSASRTSGTLQAPSTSGRTVAQDADIAPGRHPSVS